MGGRNSEGVNPNAHCSFNGGWCWNLSMRGLCTSPVKGVSWFTISAYSQQKSYSQRKMFTSVTGRDLWPARNVHRVSAFQVPTPDLDLGQLQCPHIGPQIRPGMKCAWDMTGNTREWWCSIGCGGSHGNGPRYSVFEQTSSLHMAMPKCQTDSDSCRPHIVFRLVSVDGYKDFDVMKWLPTTHWLPMSVVWWWLRPHSTLQLSQHLVNATTGDIWAMSFRVFHIPLVTHDWNLNSAANMWLDSYA